MLSRFAKACLIGIIGYLGSANSRADVPGGVLWGPPLQAIRDAASLGDPVVRETALREAIRKGLLESEPGVAHQVFSYLSRSDRWLDLRPFEDIIMEYSRIDPLHRGAGLLDEAELPRLPRDERLPVYSTAIIEGRATLRRGDILVRQTAMGLAACDGLEELKPLIEAHYMDEPEEVRQRLPLAELLIRLELGAGAVDREDAGRLASERLAAMKDQEFRDRMNTDEAFRKVVDQVASYVCAIDAFAPRRNPGCASVKDIVTRQMGLEEMSLKASKAAATSTSPVHIDEAWHETWLGRMKQLSAGEPHVERPH